METSAFGHKRHFTGAYKPHHQHWRPRARTTYELGYWFDIVVVLFAVVSAIGYFTS